MTRSKIKELLPADSIASNARLVLVNAIYFKAVWQEKFDKELTRESEFKFLNSGTVKVQMMDRRGYYKMAHFPELKSRALKIPFEWYAINLA